MSPRLRKISLRLVLPLLLLVVIGLVAFTWIAYWPLEGSVDDMTSLVPADVDFVYMASWKGMRESGWIERQVFDDPVVAALRDNETLDVMREQLVSQISEVEEQINSQIPFGLATFSVEDDMIRGDVLQAGRFCEGSDPKYGPPTVNQVLFLTRLSWKGKFISAIKHGWARDNARPNGTLEDVGDGIFRLTMHGFHPSPVRARALCGPGVVRPPENVWFLYRYKDVLAFCNDLDLARDVQRLAEDPDQAHSYVDRLEVTRDEGILDHPPDGIAASIDLAPMRHYMIRSIEMAGPPMTILSHYMTFNALDRMNGRLLFPSPDVMRGEAEIRYRPSLLADGIADVYALPAQPLGESVATLLPADDTFGALLLRTPPLHLIQAIYKEVLTPGDRQMWQQNLRKMERYQDIDEFFAEFASKLSDTAGIAVARMSDRWDGIDYQSFYDDPEQYPDPNWPAMAFIVRLNEGTRVQELDDYLAERVPLLGGSRDLEKREHMGLPYTRIHLKVQSADYAVMEPAYLLAQDHFVFCSNERYFKKIIETMVDPANHPPLAQDPTFRSTLAQLPESAHVAFFLDLDKLFRVPPSADVGSMPRGFMWDRRAIWIRANRNSYDAVVAFRRELNAADLKRTGRPPTAQRAAEINRKVEEYAKEWEQRFPEFLEDYRRELAGYARLRAFGLGIRAQRPSLFVKIPFLLQPTGDAGNAE